MEAVSSFEKWHGKKVPSEIMVCECPRSILYLSAADLLREKGEKLPVDMDSPFSRFGVFLQGFLSVGAACYKNFLLFPKKSSFRAYVHELTHSADYTGNSRFSGLCRKQNSDELSEDQKDIVNIILEGRAFLAEKFARPFSQKLRDFPIEAINDIWPCAAMGLVFSKLGWPAYFILVAGAPIYFISDFLADYLGPSQHRIGKKFMRSMLKLVGDSKKIMEVTAERPPETYSEISHPKKYVARLQEQCAL